MFRSDMHRKGFRHCLEPNHVSDEHCRHSSDEHCRHSARLKDVIIDNLNGSQIYLVLECLQCDLRTYMNSCRVGPDVASVKVRPGLRPIKCP